MDKKVILRIVGTGVGIAAICTFAFCSSDSEFYLEKLDEYGFTKSELIGALVIVWGASSFLFTKSSILPKGKIRSIKLRGRQLISFKVAEKRVRKLRNKTDSGLTFGLLQLPAKVSTTHFAFVGSTGSGKTMSIRLLMQSTLPLIGVKPDQRALIFDAKQEVLPLLGGMGLSCEVITLSPFDKRCAGWDVAGDVTSVATAHQVASILVPVNKESAQPFFERAVRSLVSGILISFIQHSPGEWRLLDLLLAMRSPEAMKAIVKRSDATKNRLEFFNDPELCSNIMVTVQTVMQQYEVVASRWAKAERKISLKEWLKTDSILVIGHDESLRAALDPINQVLFKRLSELILAQDGSDTRGTQIYLDELREAPKFEGLTSLLNKGRSNGVSVVIGFQDIEGLRSAYTKEGAHEILSQCANKAIFRTDSSETAEWASKLFGDEEVMDEKNSNSQDIKGFFGSGKSSKSTSYEISRRPVVMPSEILSLPPTLKENGLAGFYLVPLVGAYRATVSGKWLDEKLKPPDETIPKIIPCNDEDQFLEWWTPDDLRRLGLEHLGAHETWSAGSDLDEVLKGPTLNVPF